MPIDPHQKQMRSRGSHVVTRKALLATLTIGLSILAQPDPAAAQSISMWGYPYHQTDVVWVLDRSGSMAWGSPPPLSDMKANVTAGIQQLRSTQHFNVIAFNNFTLEFQPGLVPATPTNRAAAIAFVNAILADGITCSGNACVAALSQLSSSPSPSRAIFFCSDGDPNCPGATVELAQILNANFSMIPIHTFQLGFNPIQFLGQLATATGGTFVDTNVPASPTFRRGDVNDDGNVNLSDAIGLTDYLFHAGPVPTCLDAADCDTSDFVDLNDAVYLLNYLFSQGPLPEFPGPYACGTWTPGLLGICNQANCP